METDIWVTTVYLLQVSPGTQLSTSTREWCTGELGEGRPALRLGLVNRHTYHCAVKGQNCCIGIVQLLDG